MALLSELKLRNIVHFLGPYDRPMELLPHFRAFLMLSRKQGCPNASLEALAVGLPVVANPDGGTAEQIQHGVSGFLHNESDSVSLARSLAYLLLNPLEADKMGRHGQAYTTRNFSMETMFERYSKAFWSGLSETGADDSSRPDLLFRLAR